MEHHIPVVFCKYININWSESIIAIKGIHCNLAGYNVNLSPNKKIPDAFRPLASYLCIFPQPYRKSNEINHIWSLCTPYFAHRRGIGKNFHFPSIYGKVMEGNYVPWLLRQKRQYLSCFSMFLRLRAARRTNKNHPKTQHKLTKTCHKLTKTNKIYTLKPWKMIPVKLVPEIDPSERQPIQPILFFRHIAPPLCSGN